MRIPTPPLGPRTGVPIDRRGVPPRLLSRRMRDCDVRFALRQSVLAKHIRDPNTLVLDELGLEQGASRVDIAVINGRLHGYEIKSDADTLGRLPSQVMSFSRVLDRVTLVVGVRHATAAQRIVPEWWGVCVAAETGEGLVRFHPLRRERPNPTTDMEAVAALLWRDEALSLLEASGRAQGFRSKPRRDLYRALAGVLAPRELRRSVRQALRSRTGWRAA